jgi:hypothetical protein
MSDSKPLTITFACPNCSAFLVLPFDDTTGSFSCTSCQTNLTVTEGAVRQSHIERCIVCPSTELFIRKDFPQRLGVGFVVLGFALSCVAWYYHMVITTFAILFATALIDVGLFLFMGDLLECYRCHAQYRGVSNIDSHEAFDLEIHERYRQQKARLNQ